MDSKLEGCDAAGFGQHIPFGGLHSPSSEDVGGGKFAFGSDSNTQATGQDDSDADHDVESDDKRPFTRKKDSTDEPPIPFKFQQSPAPHFRPHLKPKSRRARYLMHPPIDAQNSGRSSSRSLENASLGEKENFAEMFPSSSIHKPSTSMEVEDWVPASEDAQDSRVYSNGPLVGSASSLPISNTKVVDMEEILRAVGEMNLKVGPKIPVTNKEGMKKKEKKKKKKKPATAPQKQSIFIQPSDTTRRARIADAQARVLASGPLHLNRKDRMEGLLEKYMPADSMDTENVASAITSKHMANDPHGCHIAETAKATQPPGCMENDS